jgi:hypothetical protein
MKTGSRSEETRDGCGGIVNPGGESNPRIPLLYLPFYMYLTATIS